MGEQKPFRTTQTVLRPRLRSAGFVYSPSELSSDGIIAQSPVNGVIAGAHAAILYRAVNAVTARRGLGKCP
jgi:hypothetical protein